MQPTALCIPSAPGNDIVCLLFEVIIRKYQHQRTKKKKPIQRLSWSSPCRGQKDCLGHKCHLQDFCHKTISDICMPLKYNSGARKHHLLIGSVRDPWDSTTCTLIQVKSSSDFPFSTIMLSFHLCVKMFWILGTSLAV